MPDDRPTHLPTDGDERDPMDELDDLMPPAILADFEREMCDHCGSTDTWWRSCKLLCRGCGGIVKSCADL